jgi:hypothetical protein
VDVHRLLLELSRVAGAIGLETRSIGVRSQLAGPGGLCTIRGRAVVLLNQHASEIEKSTVLADALAGRDLSAIEMAPDVRGFIAGRARSRSRLLLPERRPGPGLAHCRSESTRRRRGGS